jgi:acyl-CoA dehydrogenase
MTTIAPLASRPAVFDDESLRLFEATLRRFFDEHAPPAALEQWREDGVIPRSLWAEAARAGLLGLTIPEEFGGAGLDFRYEAALIDEMYHRGVDAFGAPLHNAIVAPYIVSFGTEAQKRRWLPKMVTGELISAIAMTEPGAGSDLRGVATRARRDGDHYVINGQKTYITNGQTANLVAVVAKTGEGTDSGAISIVFVETDEAPGFARGRNLDKVGLEAADTSELFFEDVRVPASNLLGETEGAGLHQLMAKLSQERLMIAIQGIAATERALAETVAFARHRKAFGKTILDFQNTQFKLAECKTEATIARVFVDHCIERLLKNELDAATASMAKYWVTDTQCKIIDECLQLHGGAGYMLEYPIARMYRDARVQRIYGGANETMKLLIARTL